MALTRPTAAQLNSAIVDIADPLISLNKKQTGANNKDIGIVFNRGDDLNVAIIWNETVDQFALINTAETGTTNGNVSVDSYSSLQVGAFVSSGISYPTADGTVGQVLSTNGNGTLGFTNVATTLNEVTNNGATTTNNINIGNLVTTGITVSGNIVPQSDETYSLGTPELKFSTLYVASSTVFLGDSALSVVNSELFLDGNPVKGAGDFYPGTTGDYDLSKAILQTTAETPFESGGTDSFGVSLSIVFDNMTPEGAVVTIDLGSSEAHVGA